MSDKAYFKYLESLSLEQQMAIQRQPYSNEDSGIPLPVVEPIPAPIDTEWLAYVENCREQIGNYLKLMAIAESAETPIELKLEAVNISKICLRNLGYLGMNGREIGTVIDGNFRWQP
jgi:hypothetical protein